VQKHALPAVFIKQPVRHVCAPRRQNNGTAQISTCCRIKGYVRTEQNRTEQNRTEQNRKEQNRTEQNRTEQNRTEQNKTKQNVILYGLNAGK